MAMTQDFSLGPQLGTAGVEWQRDGKLHEGVFVIE